MLEAAQHEANSFVTLTYSDDNLPGDMSVCPRELSLFVKRLRKSYPGKFRYFGCGEYGDKSGRPHYHLALFGFPGCQYGITRQEKANCCETCSVISRAWPFGQIMLGTLEDASAAYVAGYVTKKWKQFDKGDRAPEFVRMSLRPGIGLGMMHELASTLMQHRLDERMIDVPTTLQHGTKQWPLGRYLRRKLRTFIGREANAPAEVLAAQEDELQALRKTAWDHQKPLKTEILEKSLGRRIQMEARHRRQKRETI